jgi:adenylate cyclase
VFRVGFYLGDVVEESDGDLMGDGVNIAARRRRTNRPALPGSSLAGAKLPDRMSVKVTVVGEAITTTTGHDHGKPATSSP